MPKKDKYIARTKNWRQKLSKCNDKVINRLYNNTILIVFENEIQYNQTA